MSSWLNSGLANGLMPYRKKWLPSLTLNQPESLRRVWVCLFLSHTLQRCAKLRAQRWKKKKDKTQQQRNNWFPVSTPPPPLSLFAIRQDPNDFHSPSPPLPPPTPPTPSSCRNLLQFFAVAFPLAFIFAHSPFFDLIEIAPFEMEKLFTLTAEAFGWRSYPEPLVTLLETKQQQTSCPHHSLPQNLPRASE